MTEITQILSQIEQGDPTAAEQLLPLVYNDLRKLAAAKLANEKPGQTLQATALVHDAYIRLVDVEKAQHWNSRGHFFGAAAEAMRRILVENARRKSRTKRGANMQRRDLENLDMTAESKPEEILQVDAALERLEARNAMAASLVKLRYFAGFTNQEAAKTLGVSSRKASQLWTYARTVLLADIENQL